MCKWVNPVVLLRINRVTHEHEITQIIRIRLELQLFNQLPVASNQHYLVCHSVTHTNVNFCHLYISHERSKFIQEEKCLKT